MTSSDFHRVVIIAGTSSNSGKTTLLCDLMRELSRDESWEAIKLTRGHYRSCGKDPHACCVSHLLSAEPVVRSGREATYTPGKDTGRYWDAGAANVHWLIATDEQVEAGIKQSLARVQSEGVFVEGNSFAQFVDVDFFVMVRRSDEAKIKKSARQVMDDADAIYVSDSDDLGLLIDRVRAAVKGGGVGVA